MFDFWRVTVFFWDAAFHEMTMYAKKLGRHGTLVPLATPMIGNTTGILADNLLVATYALSYLCIPVSSTVVE